MKKSLDLAETCLNVVGLTVSLSDINNILNIILLIVSVLAILVRGFFEIKKHIENKEYDKAVETFEDTKEKLEDLTNKGDE